MLINGGVYPLRHGSMHVQYDIHFGATDHRTWVGNLLLDSVAAEHYGRRGLALKLPYYIGAHPSLLDRMIELFAFFDTKFKVPAHLVAKADQCRRLWHFGAYDEARLLHRELMRVGIHVPLDRYSLYPLGVD